MALLKESEPACETEKMVGYAEEVLGADYSGNIGHDGWMPYDGFYGAS